MSVAKLSTKVQEVQSYTELFVQSPPRLFVITLNVPPCAIHYTCTIAPLLLTILPQWISKREIFDIIWGKSHQPHHGFAEMQYVHLFALRLEVLSSWSAVTRIGRWTSQKACKLRYPGCKSISDRSCPIHCRKLHHALHQVVAICETGNHIALEVSPNPKS